ncbi:LOW QUALITY PROTEIN: uncharacterized protein [Phyllobates terribilis]|uniref:LOW QUALITY PROTEIN: uncharacterized protein n=1 Tax=Phyllobates terribilis TaxID=111132 RepID=UPI003CCB4145
MLASLAPCRRSPLLCSASPADFNSDRRFGTIPAGFPPFLPKEVQKIKDYHAIKFAKRIQRIPVPVSSSESCIMSSCIRPLIQGKTDPIVLLHGFDSSCLEWRYVHPLLEKDGLESWAIDILGWGFSDVGIKGCILDVASKRDHLYELWRTYIKRPMVVVGSSLGAAVAIDFAVNHPEAVSKLIFICGSVYEEGTGTRAILPRPVAYAGVALLKSVVLRLCMNIAAFNNLSFSACVDRMNVSRLHCLMPWWEDVTINFMSSGGYNVAPLIKQVKQKCLIIRGENDQITSYKNAVRLHCELQNATVRQLSDCGHIPHLEKPRIIADLIKSLLKRASQSDRYKLDVWIWIRTHHQPDHYDYLIRKLWGGLLGLKIKVLVIVK